MICGYLAISAVLLQLLDTTPSSLGCSPFAGGSFVVVVDSLLIVAPFVEFCVFVSCFVVYCFVSFLLLQ